jgi:hypothetical protein
MLDSKIAFKLGFVVGLLIFTLANSLSYIQAVSRSFTYKFNGAPIGDAFGFPFTFYYAFGGPPDGTRFLWVEAIANFLIMLICSFVLGLICRSIFRD